MAASDSRGLAPGLFIPAAERTGLIVPLGKWVLAEACRQARRWLDEGIAPDRVAVNFSALQFKIPGELEKEIDAVLAETGLPARHAGDGVDRNHDHGDDAGSQRYPGGLPKRGITIAIDDFGTGYSSLSYLRRFPVDRIKLAQEFIVDLVTDPSDAVDRPGRHRTGAPLGNRHDRGGSRKPNSSSHC